MNLPVVRWTEDVFKYMPFSSAQLPEFCGAHVPAFDNMTTPIGLDPYKPSTSPCHRGVASLWGVGYGCTWCHLVPQIGVTGASRLKYASFHRAVHAIPASCNWAGY